MRGNSRASNTALEDVALQRKGRQRVLKGVLLLLLLQLLLLHVHLQTRRRRLRQGRLRRQRHQRRRGPKQLQHRLRQGGNGIFER